MIEEKPIDQLVIGFLFHVFGLQAIPREHLLPSFDIIKVIGVFGCNVLVVAGKHVVEDSGNLSLYFGRKTACFTLFYVPFKDKKIEKGGKGKGK